MGDRERLVLARRAAERDAAGRRVVDVGYCRSGTTGHGFDRAMPVGVGGQHAHLFAHLRFAQSEAARRGARNGAPRRAVNRALPLVAETAQPVRIGQAVGGRERLVLARRTAERDPAGRRIVGVSHRDREALTGTGAGQIGCRELEAYTAHVAVGRRAAEGARRGIKDEPARQRTAVSQGGREA